VAVQIAFWIGLCPSRLCGQQAAAPSSPDPVIALPANLHSKLDEFQAYLKAAQAKGDHHTEAVALNDLGTIYGDLGEPKKALEFYNQALPILRSLRPRDRKNEATTLNNIGKTYDDLRDEKKALKFFEQALEIYENESDQRGVAVTYSNIGMASYHLGEKQEALNSLGQSLALALGANAYDVAGKTLINLGAIYEDLGDYQKALVFYNKAQQIFHAIRDPNNEAGVLLNIGNLLHETSELQKSLESYNQALSLARAVGNPDLEAKTLNSIGAVYAELGQDRKALDFCEHALLIIRTVSDPPSEALILQNLAAVYDEIGDEQNVLDFYNQALSILALSDPDGEIAVLNNIGQVYDASGKRQEALENYTRALLIARRIGNRGGEAQTLTNLGQVFDAIGEKQKALYSYNQALPIATGMGNLLAEAAILDGLSASQEKDRPSLAIFYAKQAVNIWQQVLGSLKGLDKGSQKSFLTSKTTSYRALAALLIDESRLSEAERVLDLLKDEEYDRFVRGESTIVWGQLSLTATEQQAKVLFDTSLGKAAQLSKRWSELNSKSELVLTSEEEVEFKALPAQIAEATNALDVCHRQLGALFQKPVPTTAFPNPTESNALEELTREVPGTIGLYTLVVKDRYRVIVIDSAGAKPPREYAISEKDLNRTIAKFRHALEDPKLDPLPAAQELYKIVIGPVEDLLTSSHPSTLLWSLDGVLRYIPVAALNDGSQYMVEKYANVVISTRNAHAQNASPDPARLEGVGFGLYNQLYPSEPTLPKLPNVRDELFAIIHDQQKNSSKGVVPGTIVMNDDFTEAALEYHLQKGPPIVHIASHFVFNAGDDRGSFLLLAGEKQGGLGYELSLAELNRTKELTFEGIELLALSACETGVGGVEQDGHEVDGLGTMAQRKGAEAVMASLWEVDDASTTGLMQEFYQNWVHGKGVVSKSVALQQAQLALLQQKITPTQDPDNPNAPTSFAHPHYWAPFILMGNWR
jgi:CHAT domain-containing protein/Tfp pilus assembly protein PilF